MLEKNPTQAKEHGVLGVKRRRVFNVGLMTKKCPKCKSKRTEFSQLNFTGTYHECKACGHEFRTKRYL